MKKSIVVLAVVLSSVLATAQRMNFEGSFVDVRVEIPLETEVISHSLSITLNQKEGYNSYDGLKYRTLKEQEDHLMAFLDSVGVKKSNVKEDKTYLTSSYYKKSLKFIVSNVTPEQISSIGAINKGDTFVADRKTLFRIKDSEEVLIKKALEAAKTKAGIIAAAVGKKLVDVKYVTCTGTFEKEFESTYGSSSYYPSKYYMTVGYNISE
ncbi:MAG: SIMPL domain-containing protein [Aestuariibaculum sp.]